MKRLGLLACASVPAWALGTAGVVSVYDFDNTLNPYFAANAHVGALSHRTGGAPTSPYGGTSFVSDIVGSTTKQVVNVPSPTFFDTPHGIGANGGGSYVNQYSILMDVKVDSSHPAWCSLFSTAADNSNDGDSFLRWNGNDYSIGTVGSYGGSFIADKWYRIIITVDASSVGGHTLLKYYKDGVLAHSVDTTSSGLDGRWTLYSWDDGDPDSDSIDVFGDNSGDNFAGRASLLAFFDGVVDDNVARSFGGPGSPVPEPSALLGLGIGIVALLKRRNRN